MMGKSLPVRPRAFSLSWANRTSARHIAGPNRTLRHLLPGAWRQRCDQPGRSAEFQRHKNCGKICLDSGRLPAHSLALRPAHLRRHLYVTCYTEGFSHFVTSMTAPVASGLSDLAGWDSHPLESAALSRRTREADIAGCGLGRLNWAEGAPTRTALGRTGVRAKAVIPSRARNRKSPAWDRAVEEGGRHADRGAFGAARSIGKARNGAGARETHGPRQMTLSSA
jgi:hypothetical protein